MEQDRAKAIRVAIEDAGPDDLVLIAGKGHEDYQIFADETIHFDDREVAAEVLREIEGAGLLTNVPHEMVLMASALGQADDLRGFRDRCRARFFSGDAEAIGEMLQRINENVVPRSAAVGPAAPPTAA